jgi:hypothetical protein
MLTALDAWLFGMFMIFIARPRFEHLSKVSANGASVDKP